MSKRKTILLIDDDDDTHFLHRRIIRKADPDAHVVSVTDGQQALEYLDRVSNGDEVCPEHIWLDLQMPRMDGWAFMQEFRAKDLHYPCDVTVTIVTTSPNPDDKARALAHEHVNGFVQKFMSEEEAASLLNVNRRTDRA